MKFQILSRSGFLTPVSYSSGNTKSNHEILSRESVKIPDKNKDLKQFLPLQSKDHSGKRTLVLDLDETLVHAKFVDIVENKADHFFKISFNHSILPVHLYVRPGAQDFIREMAKHYEIVIFTASRPAYANKVIDIIDPDNLVAHRLFRDSCSEHTIPDEDNKKKTSFWVKDMSRLSRYIDDVVIIDNSPSAYIYQKENGMPITSWFGDQNDCELYQYLNIFRMVAKFNIDLKYIILNIVKEDHSINHEKFGEIINAAISKDNFAKKTRDYRIVHESSCSPVRKSLIKLDTKYNALMTCQIQTDFNVRDSDEDDSDSERYSNMLGNKNIKSLMEIKPKYNSIYLKTGFGDSADSTLKPKSLYESFKNKQSSKKRKSLRLQNPKILIQDL